MTPGKLRHIRHGALRLAGYAALLLLAAAAAAAAQDAHRQAPALPPSSVLDFTGTLEAPAGQHGLVGSGADGHFYFADGTRVRFWGINVSSTRLDIPAQQIETVVDNFARAGINLVRLEAVDNRNCLLGKVDASDSLHFDRRYRDKVDRWTDSLRRHGIYYYLDLLDLRTFKAGDGVTNADSMDRGARPYALFDKYLIRLQKDYAYRFLTHRNPYSGLRPVDDPALAMVEICNESGFFLYPERLESLVEPYKSDLRADWNAWLRAHYQARSDMAAAWMDSSGTPGLRNDEDPAQGNVDLPNLSYGATPTSSNGPEPNQPDVRRAPGRQRDGVKFLVDVQRGYIREMHDYLRSIGLRVPITAVVSSDVIPDVASVSEECDFTSENWYGDGENDDPKTPGVHYSSNRNPLTDDSTGGFAPYTAALRWNKKPVVVREWAVPWPNVYRAGSVPEVLAYASLQDLDAVLLFGYQTNRAPNGAEADALNDLAFQSDATVWGLYAIAGQAFLRGGIAPGRTQLTLVYPPDRQSQWPNRTGDLLRAAWVCRLASADVGTGLGQEMTPAGGPDDMRALRDFVDKLHKAGAPVSVHGISVGVWRSDTGEIALFSHDGRLEVNAPTVRVLAGQLKPNKVYDLGGGLHFSTPTPFGALIVMSLDGRPVEKSRHIVAKMVTRAENTGQDLEKADTGEPGDWVLKAPGAAPVVTFGRQADASTRLWIETPPRRARQAPVIVTLLDMPILDGTWEIECRSGHATVACDTPGIAGVALGQPFTTSPGGVVVSEKSPEPPAGIVAH